MTLSTGVEGAPGRGAVAGIVAATAVHLAGWALAYHRGKRNGVREEWSRARIRANLRLAGAPEPGS